MIPLVAKTNVNAPNAVFPYGDLRNDPGNNTGTPVDRELLSDLIQTVEKIMADSGVVPNGLADNDSNGWQVFDAMRTVFGGNPTINWMNLPDAAYIYPTSEGAPQIFRDSSGFVHFRGTWNTDDPDPNEIIGTLPLGFRPTTDLRFSYSAPDAPTSATTGKHYEFTVSATSGVINCTNTVGNPMAIFMINFPSFQANI